MKILVRWLVVSLLTITTALAQAPSATTLPQSSQPGQDPKPASSVATPRLREFVQDELHIWTSPLKRANYNSHVLGKYVIPFTLLSGALIATDHKTGHLLPNTPQQRIWSGRVSQIGASYTLAGVSGGSYLL